MEDKNLVIIVAMICLTVIEAMALYSGHNGQILTIVLGLVAGLAGFYGGATVKDKLKGFSL